MAHINELYDFTVSAFIVHADKVLLLHHKKLNTWLQPGGHIELNEDPETALWREILEETGLRKEELKIIEVSNKKLPLDTASRNKRLPIPFDLNVHPFGDDPVHKHIDFCYLIASNTEEISQNIQESNELRWFTQQDIEEAKENLLPDIYTRARFILNNTDLF